jgi:hypothetical protein
VPAEAGIGYLIDPRFGVAPGEPLNRTPAVKGRVWEELAQGISERARDDKLTPLNVAVSRRCDVGREGDRAFYPPTVTGGVLD